MSNNEQFLVAILAGSVTKIGDAGSPTFPAVGTLAEACTFGRYLLLCDL